MPKIFATIGIPGSGKTTFASEQIALNGGARANRDDIRFTTYGVHFGPPINEQVVSRIQDEIVAKALADGLDVWIDDTNLTAKSKRHCQELAELHGVELEWVDFTNVPLEVCIERDSKRDRQVGESVIRGMYEKYLA